MSRVMTSNDVLGLFMLCLSFFRATAVTSCGLGYRCTVANTCNTCVACECGKYNSFTTTSTTCSDCATGRYSTTTQADICSSCPLNSMMTDPDKKCVRSCACNAGFDGGPSVGGQCTACVQGKYKSSVDTEPCTACPTGKSNMYTQSEVNDCNVCAPGYSGDGTTCTMCVTGKYKDYIGNGDCLTCSNPQNPPGSTVCSCGAGTGTTSCTACASGTYKDTIGPADCTSCPAGKYSYTTGLSACIDCNGVVSADRISCSCNAGYSGTGFGQFACTACAAGKYKASAGGCVDTPNWNEPGRTFVKCAYYKNPSMCWTPEWEIKNCCACQGKDDMGVTYADSVWANSQCQNCPQNSSSVAGSTSCQCNTGYILINSVCTTCPPNSGAAAGSSVCECFPGYTGPNGGTCSACDPGKYKVALGSAVCSACGAGKYSAAEAATSDTTCTACEPGKYSTAEAATAASMCLSCAAGKYKTVAGSGACIDCLVGKYSAEAASTCSSCEAGKYKTVAGSGACIDCVEGKYSTVVGATAELTCSPCSAWLTSLAGSSSVAACLCRPGSSGPNTQGYCDQCVSGKYKPEAGPASCQNCVSGKYSSIGQAQCSNCPDNSDSLAASTSVSNCICNAGLFGSNGGPCTKCVAGKYKSEPGRGVYSANTNSYDCTDCGQGTYSTTIGATANSTCSTCPEYSYSPLASSGFADCTCQPGFKGPDAELCSPCAPYTIPNTIFNDSMFNDSMTYQVSLQFNYQVLKLALTPDESSLVLSLDAGNEGMYVMSRDTGQITPLVSQSQSPEDFYDASEFAITRNSLYVITSHGRDMIREINFASGTWRHIAGAQGISGFSDGTGTMAKFRTPRGVACTPDTDCTTIFVADSENHRIRQIVRATGAVSTLAGQTNTGNADGFGTLATFNKPVSIVVTPDGLNVLVADQYNNVIRKIVINTRRVSTIAGGSTVLNKDGVGTLASLSYPRSISITSDGSTILVHTGILYEYALIRYFDLSTMTVRTINTTNLGVRSIYTSTITSDMSTLIVGSYNTKISEITPQCREPCPAGASSSSGVLPCTVCAAGKYKAEVGPGACSDCGAGTYSPAVGATKCSACPANSDSSPGSSTVTECTCNAGYSAGSMGSCDACVVMTFKELTGNGSCSSCPAGKYSLLTGSSTCLACVAGKSVNTPSASYTFTYDGGTGNRAFNTFFRIKNSMGVPLRVPFSNNQGYITMIEGGILEFVFGTNETYSLEPVDGYGSGVPWSNGAFVTVRKGGSILFSVTKDNFAPVSFTTDPICLCPENSQSSTLSSACTCNAGFSGLDGGTCTQCVAGKYKAEADPGACSDCGAGKYSEVVGATAVSTCRACPSGTNSPPGSSDLASCICNAGTTACIDQPNFSATVLMRLFEMEAQSCSYYAAHQRPEDIRWMCENNYDASGVAALDACCACIEFCHQCVAGKYKAEAGPGACTDCGAGNYSEVVGATDVSTCLVCVAGKYKAEAGPGACSDCQANSYSPPGSTSADECLCNPGWTDGV